MHALMSRIIQTIHLPDENATMDAGVRLAPTLRCGDIVLLQGDLGAGKTTFSRGLITSMCGEVDVPSPTYTLVQTYDAPTLSIWHFDLYRLDAPEDIWELGIEEAFEHGACLIEWPERIKTLLGGAELTLRFTHAQTGRRLDMIGDRNWEARLA